MLGFGEINRDNILKEGNPILREKSKEVTFPLSDNNKMLINNMVKYLFDSNDEEIAEVKNLEPAVGIAAPQVGKNIRIFTLFLEMEQDFIPYVVINPKIIKKSKNQSFLKTGEGCLSVPSREEGYVYRSSEIEVEFYNIKEEKQKMKLKDFNAIAFQHEFDHLEGKLYIDYINKENPLEEKRDAKEI